MGQINEDPPWLGEAATIVPQFVKLLHEPGSEKFHQTCRDLVRAVLAFAARQPRPITEAMAESAAQAIDEVLGPIMARPERMEQAKAGRTQLIARLGRAALEAAEKARAA